MKKAVFFIITVTLLLSFSSVAFAKTNKTNKHKGHQAAAQQVKMQKADDDEDDNDDAQEQKSNKVTAKAQKAKEEKAKEAQKVKEEKAKEAQGQEIKAKKQDFKIDGSPVIKIGKVKLPIRPITKGMGAKVTYDKAASVLTVVKDDNTIVIDFKNKTVTVNGVEDTDSGIFTAKNSSKMTVLIKYIANELGIRVKVDKKKVTVEVPGLNAPTNVTVTTDGTTVLPNTVNSTTLSLTATAAIKAGQAAGGRAELYVGAVLVATDSEILKTDTAVNFTTSDGTPVNDELKALVPEGGVVTVKLYNAKNNCVVSKDANPTLVVDYTVPTVASINSATYTVTGTTPTVSGSAITIAVTGASAVGDKVDVTKITLTDTATGKTYQLTNASTGVVSSENTLVITLGDADVLGLKDFGTALSLSVAAGSLLTDAAGNTSLPSAAVQTVPITVVNN